MAEICLSVVLINALRPDQRKLTCRDQLHLSNFWVLKISRSFRITLLHYIYSEGGLKNRGDSWWKKDDEMDVCGAKSTTIKEALKKWEEHNQKSSSEALEIELQFQWQPIEKMDNSLSQKLSLSTNMIEKITGLSGMKNLKILSLSRNYIKSFAGLECLAETLEQLWISYNLIDKMKGVGALKKLKVLNMNNNLIKDWAEFQKLQENPELKELSFIGNPLCESVEEGMWKSEATRRLPQIEKLDGEPVICEINATL